MSGEFRDALADLLEWAESVTAGWVPGPAAMHRARALLAEAQPVCVACEGRPAPGNSPCGLCGLAGKPQLEPVEPTQQELEDLAYAFGREYDEGRLMNELDAAAFGRAVLARWGRPALVPQEQADA
jgi:hypothetical protein